MWKFSNSLYGNLKTYVFTQKFSLRYKLILITLGKELAKQIEKQRTDKYLQQCLRSCDKAVDCMHEVNNFVNRFIKDTEYRSSVRKFSDRIRFMDTDEIKKMDIKYGRLSLEGQLTFKKETESHYNDRSYLMCFQRRIFIFEIVHSKRKFLSLFLNATPTDSTKDTYNFVGSLPISNSMSVTVEKHPDHSVLKVRNLHEFLPIPHESFSAKFTLKVFLPFMNRRYMGIEMTHLSECFLA